MPSERKDPDLPILDRPWDYSIVGLVFFRALDSSEESYLDLTLQRGSDTRRFRFFSPQGIRLEDGFPASPGLCFLDVSRRGMEGIRVRVDDFEAGGGGLHFWARNVIDLDEYEKNHVAYQVAGANRRWPFQFRCRGSRHESAVAQLSTLGGITRMKITTFSWILGGAYLFCAVMFFFIITKSQAMFSELGVVLPALSRVVFTIGPLGWLLLTIAIGSVAVLKDLAFRSQALGLAFTIILAVLVGCVIAGVVLPTIPVQQAERVPPNKSLQPTRDGAFSSASRFTRLDPAWLSLGR